MVRIIASSTPISSPDEQPAAVASTDALPLVPSEPGPLTSRPWKRAADGFPAVGRVSRSKRPKFTERTKRALALSAAPLALATPVLAACSGSTEAPPTSKAVDVSEPAPELAEPFEIEVDGRTVEVRPPPSTTTTTPPTTTTAPPTTTTTSPPPPVDPALSPLSNVEKLWSEPAAGVRHLSVTASGQKLDIVEIDLAAGNYDVRATRPDERGQTVSQFAASVNAVVTINADFFEFGSYQPSGIAVGDGHVWPNTNDRAEWLFLACDGNQNCIIDDPNQTTQLNPDWTDVVGGAGAPLVLDGQAQVRGDPVHAGERHPRTAVGVTEDGKLIFLVAAGRANNAAGMTYDEMAVIMAEMNADRAINLDGGGSSALVVMGERVNQLPGHGNSERVVANHLAIVPQS